MNAPMLPRIRAGIDPRSGSQRIAGLFAAARILAARYAFSRWLHIP